VGRALWERFRRGGGGRNQRRQVNGRAPSREWTESLQLPNSEAPLRPIAAREPWYRVLYIQMLIAVALGIFVGEH